MLPISLQLKPYRYLLGLTSTLIICTSLSGCMSTMPKMGGGSGDTITGGTAGSAPSNKNSKLESCTETLGTLSVFEDTSLSWWRDYRRRYPKLGSTLPVIRLMIQQSNCFVVVERGKAMQAMNRERQLMQSGQLRNGSNIGGGQMVAADYTISPEIQFSQKGTKGFKAIGGALLGKIGSLVGGGASKNEASTTLLLIDNRSGVQVSAAVGNAGNYDYNFLGGVFTGGFGSGGNAYTNTPEGKVISAAFADSFNQMVIALRNYKPQEVKGGLGKGGQLTVGGANDATPQATNTASIVQAPRQQTVVRNVNVTTRSTVRNKRSYDFEIEEYDERALEKYYDSLKQLSEFSAGITTLSASSANSQHKDMAKSALSMFTNKMASNKIELEHWPLEAKQEAWKVLGRRIEKHNAIFTKHRETTLKNESIDDDFLNILTSIELITKESLFGG